MEFITAGESHGPALTTIVTGMPAGVHIDEDAINYDMARRQRGFGRGKRQAIETDKAQVLSGVRFSTTLGSPITLQVVNRDFANWTGRMDVFGEVPADLVKEQHPRPGHADLVGMLKTNTDDARNILERSSARETAARVAAGGVAKALLRELGVSVGSYVVRIGKAAVDEDALPAFSQEDVEASDVRCPVPEVAEAMRDEIRQAINDGESLGGQYVVRVEGLVPGLGSYASGPERLTSQLAAAIMSIQAHKAVEFGLGVEVARRVGSKVHDGIGHDGQQFTRRSNNAGGLEGGMTTGYPLVIRATMKPIPTLMAPMYTVDFATKELHKASTERSDTCAVPAAAVVAEAEVAMVLADAYLKAFGCTNLADLKANIANYLERIAQV